MVEGTVFNNQTIRMYARVSIGGDKLRIRLSNAYGTKPLTIGAVHVGAGARSGSIAGDSDRTVTFAGADGGKIGASAVTLYVPETIPRRIATKIAIEFEMRAVAIAVASLGT